MHPLRESSQTLGHWSGGLPPEIVQRLPDITDEDSLIARSPILNAVFDLLRREGLQMVDELEQRTRVRGSAPDIVDFAVALLDPRDGSHVTINQIIDKKQIAHLLPVAIDLDGFPEFRGNGEPGHPPLIF